MPSIAREFRRCAIGGKKTELGTKFKSWDARNTNFGDDGKQSQQSVCGSKRGPEEETKDFRIKKKSRLRMGPSMALKCFVALKKLMSHPYGERFNHPVDFSGRKPMDLGTVEWKFERDFYATADEFESDINLTFSTAMRCYPPGNPLHDMAKELHSLFTALYPTRSLSNASQVNAKNKEPSKVNLSDKPALEACNLKAPSTSTSESSDHLKIVQKSKSISYAYNLQKNLGCKSVSQGHDKVDHKVNLSDKPALEACNLKAPSTSTSESSDHLKNVQKSKCISYGYNLQRNFSCRSVSPGHDKVDQKHKTASQDPKLQRQREREAARIARDNMESSDAFEDNISILTELAYMTGDFSFAGPLGGSGAMYVNRKLWRPLERFGLYLKQEKDE